MLRCIPLAPSYMLILHEAVTLSSKKLKVSEKLFGEAIRGLQDDLKLATQSEMASLVGCSLDIYRNWVNDRSQPSAIDLVRLLSLCPSPESLQRFGVDYGRFAPQVEHEQQGGAVPHVRRIKAKYKPE
jgi:DNA-binding transcriptional regulator YiaG